MSQNVYFCYWGTQVLSCVIGLFWWDKYPEERVSHGKELWYKICFMFVSQLAFCATSTPLQELCYRSFHPENQTISSGVPFNIRITQVLLLCVSKFIFFPVGNWNRYCQLLCCLDLYLRENLNLSLQCHFWVSRYRTLSVPLSVSLYHQLIDWVSHNNKNTSPTSLRTPAFRKAANPKA